MSQLGLKRTKKIYTGIPQRTDRYAPTEITVSANNHSNQSGQLHHSRLCRLQRWGVEGFNLSQTALSPRNQKVNPQTTYYSQRDPRWAGKYYGVSNVDQSGCVPNLPCYDLYRYPR